LQHRETIVKSEQAQTVQVAEQLGHVGRYPDGLAAERSLSRGQSRASAAIKRGLDIAFSITAVVVLAPAIAVIALIIKLDSPGPLLFKQKRIGRYGEPFRMVKFRTMADGADDRKDELRHLNEAADGLFKIHADPRITRVGRWLRKTSLDELPQLFHVLSGEMSVVGPRPLVPEEDARIQGPFRCRTEIRPGMTGPWQVAGASQVPIGEMMELDREYVENWTAWRDVSLIVRTIPHVVMRRGI
jgi:lipopolysaccharide/colanic/teichoic acid biosynthesis glycosyltransferase